MSGWVVSSKKTTISKSIHHNIELPTTCKRCLTAFGPNSGACNCWHYSLTQDQQQAGPASRQEPPPERNKFKTPRYNTVIGKVNHMETLQSLKPVPLKTTADLTPRSKALVAPKITQKLNFNPSQKLYKNLVPINVNDSILLPQQGASIRSKYTKTANKMPAPELCDFLEPLPPLTHTIPEPDIVQQFPQRRSDSYSSYMNLFDSSSRNSS